MTHTVRPFSHLEILDTLGKPRTMESLCKASPLVIGFVRHFGCALCEEQVSELMLVEHEITSAGAALAIIGNGNPEHARNFVLRTGAKNVYTDPARVVYRAFGLTHSLRSTIGVRAARNTLRAFRKGHRQGAFEGDPWQQGGTFVIREHQLVFGYWAEVAGDHAPVADVLKALRRAGRSGSGSGSGTAR